MVLYNLFFGPNEEPKLYMMKEIENIQHAKCVWEKLFPGCNDHESDLLKRLLRSDVHERISIKEVMRHLYFEQYNSDKRSQCRKTKKIKLKGYENAMKCGTTNLDPMEWRSLLSQEILCRYNKNYERELLYRWQ